MLILAQLVVFGMVTWQAGRIGYLRGYDKGHKMNLKIMKNLIDQTS